jgi:hypothetical protein
MGREIFVNNGLENRTIKNAHFDKRRKMQKIILQELVKVEIMRKCINSN